MRSESSNRRTSSSLLLCSYLIATPCFSFTIYKSLCKANILYPFDVAVNSFQMLERTGVIIFSVNIFSHEMTAFKCGHELRIWPLKMPEVCLYLRDSKTMGKNPNHRQLRSLILVYISLGNMYILGLNLCVFFILFYLFSFLFL